MIISHLKNSSINYPLPVPIEFIDTHRTDDLIRYSLLKLTNKKQKLIYQIETKGLS